ncbi:MFS transporter [Tengunoibacter tsumagoiensis]|uniref:Multidrug efflux pump Tap n=1 Tax=Tengunoibacter tsumagoiensis TaxID=2014871 RepID=A0A402A684_9CHLR|nr:MFS transporter [Tengunoibacter tsumagoiensis]GCE14525.1 putative drug antiporter protein precursor [Tengunoibacter tsumagoiensis]
MADMIARPEEELAPARYLPLLTLFVANFISFAGSMLTIVAIPWFVLQTTGSIIQTGITAFFTTVPTVLSMALGGVLVERIGYKRASVIGDFAAAIGVALIPLFYHTVGLPFWGLVTFVFIATLLNGPGGTARLALVPDLAKEAKMPLERANSISQGVSHLAGIIGAPLAGILIAFYGSSNLLWIDALSFLISAIIVAVVIPSPALRPREAVSNQPEKQAEPKAPTNFLADFQEGVRFILRDSVTAMVLLTIAVTNMLDVALTSVVVPVYVKHFFNSAVILGWLSAIFLGFAFLGTALFGAIGHRLPRMLTLAIAFVIIGLRYWVFAWTPSLPWLLIISAVSGLASAPLNPIIFTMAYEIIPDHMRARVLGAGMAVTALGMPLGTLGSGYLISWLGLPTSLILMGSVYLLATLSMLLNPSFRKLEKVRLQEKHAAEPSPAASIGLQE